MPYLGNKKFKQLHQEYLDLYGHLDLSDQKLVEETVQRFIVDENAEVFTKYLPQFYLMQENKPAFIIQWNHVTTNFLLQCERRENDPFLTETSRRNAQLLKALLSHLQQILNEYHKNYTLYATHGGPEAPASAETDMTISGFSENSAEDMQTIFGVEEAAEFLKLSKKTIYSLTSRKTIPHSKKGKRLYFTKKDLVDWINGGRRKSIDQLHADADRYIKANKMGR